MVFVILRPEVLKKEKMLKYWSRKILSIMILNIAMFIYSIKKKQKKYE